MASLSTTDRIKLTLPLADAARLVTPSSAIPTASHSCSFTGAAARACLANFAMQLPSVRECG
jgi:hypothetical protein